MTGNEVERIADSIDIEAESVAEAEVRRIRDAVERLPANQRATIELRLEGLTSGEIGLVLGRTPDAVRMIQRRALRRLREDLDNAH